MRGEQWSVRLSARRSCLQCRFQFNRGPMSEKTGGFSRSPAGCCDRKLEHELRLQFNHARRGVGSQPRTVDSCRLAHSGGYLTKLRTVDVCVRKSKVGVIKEIEEACPYRYIRTLPPRDRKRFLDIEIG